MSAADNKAIFLSCVSPVFVKAMAVQALAEEWPRLSSSQRSKLRGDLLCAPWFVPIRDDPRAESLVAEHNTASARNLQSATPGGP